MLLFKKPYHKTTQHSATQYLKAIGEALAPLGSQALFYLAAAVSDFYLPWSQLVSMKAYVCGCVRSVVLVVAVLAVVCKESMEETGLNVGVILNVGLEKEIITSTLTCDMLCHAVLCCALFSFKLVVCLSITPRLSTRFRVQMAPWCCSCKRCGVLC